MAAPDSFMNVEAASAQVKRLIMVQLKQVCRRESLPVSGTKAALQSRITTQLQSCANRGDYEAFSRLRSAIQNPVSDSNGPSPTPPSRSHANPMHPQPQYQNTYGSVAAGPSPSLSYGTSGATQRSPLFKLSPFYEIIGPLTPVIECKAIVREATRDTVQATINLSPEVVDQMSRSATRRVMIYCAADAVSSPFSRVEIAFPYQVEIKVNQDEVKSNLRGLKNKPGSTRPADITDLLRKRPGYNNDLVVTYALTKNRFFLVVNLVEQRTVGDLVARLSSGKTISKDRVVREMIGKSQDTEIVATSTIMSLKCPLSTLRIDVPCRSTSCNHNQCFDATSFLQLQEQAPTWACPVCNKGVAFDGLQIDQYVDDILKATPKSVDQVTIEPDGKWSTRCNAKSPRRSTNGHRSSDEEDDLVEIQEVPRIASIKTEASHESGMLRTPPSSSREPSTSSGAQSLGSRKRPVAQVVDLTLSDEDEDEDEVRLPKRRNNAGPPHDTPGSNGFAQMPTRAHGSSSGLPAVFTNSQPSTSFTSPLHYTHGGFPQPP